MLFRLAIACIAVILNASVSLGHMRVSFQFITLFVTLLTTLFTLAPAGLGSVPDLFAQVTAQLGAVGGFTWLALGVSLYVLHSFLKIGWPVVDDEVIYAGGVS